MRRRRSQYVKICEICENKEFSNQLGIVCSFTKQHANFEGECNDFILNVKAKKVAEETRRKRMEEQDSYSDFIEGLGIHLTGIAPFLFNYLSSKKREKKKNDTYFLILKLVK